MSELTEEKYRKLKAEVEETKAEADRAQGALDQLMSRLKDEFECSTLKEAKLKLAALTSKSQLAQAAFEKTLKDYEKIWKQ